MNNPSHFSAFILAAGEGRRLRPYTDTLPKPMVPVAGAPILAHTLNHLEQAGVKNVTINIFHKSQVIEDFVTDWSREIDITLSKETALLNTGLGIKNALENMHNKPFFAINGDAFWSNGSGGNVFERLNAAWQPDKMDILLLLQPISQMILTKGIGDYSVDQNGLAHRSLDQSGEYMFAGIRICKPEIFEETPDTPFSFLELMDLAEKTGRLGALIHDGAWHHISTPEDLERVNQSFISDGKAINSA